MTLQYANPSPACLRSTLLTFFRRFASLIQDSSVSARARAAAALELSDALLAAGVSADCDRDAAAIASDWLCSTLNTQLFFTSHASLILQVSARAYNRRRLYLHTDSPFRPTGRASMRAAAALSFHIGR
jgi:hypothetical protein